MAGKNLLVSQFPAANSQQRISASPTSGRNKVALKPGRSLMDWIRLGRSGKDLTGVGGNVLDVTPEELAKHNKQDDAWISLRGKVYNVAPYMEFHPGGIDELMRGVGKDGTLLFDEIHKWVNAESMLEKCYVGRLKTDFPSQRKGSNASRSSIKSNTLSPNGSINLHNLKPPQSGPLPPKYDWFQNSKAVTIIIYTKWPQMLQEFVIIDREGKDLLITVFVENHTFQIHIELEDMVKTDYHVKVQKDTGKVDIILPKKEPDKQWKTIGKNLHGHNSFVKTVDKEIFYRKCSVKSVTNVTHDTKLFCIALPEGTRMCVPIGYHVHIKHNISGMEIARSYTAVLPSLRAREQDALLEQGRVFYLMIKIYPSGALTPCLNNLQAGDPIEVSDIDGNFKVSSLAESSHLVMLAAGTGFTPMIKLLFHSLVEDTPAKRNVKLLFFNKKRHDILWKEQLDEFAAACDRFSLMYILSEADDDWDGPIGRVREELVKDSLPPTGDSVKLLVAACGPTPFTKEAMRLGKELGCRDDQLHAFLG